ncbi:MAG: HEAT repeat domain-containing protein [Planctomycetota bacterium]
MLTLLVSAALLQAHGSDPLPSVPEDLSDEVRQSLARMRVPDGFRAVPFAAEPLLANPVALCLDAFGRVYVAETFRHSKGVTDIRSHMDWLEDDLAIRTVEDRVAMFRKHETPEAFEAGYAVETERVRRLVDADGDGIADDSTIFADGFDDPAAGIGAGLLARPLEGGGTELWFTCIPDLWRLFDRDDDGVAEERLSHSTGYGLRVALLGHDLHGLTIGPDGRLYFSIGDRGFNVTTAEGRHLVRYGTGAVFRCELDGSDLEVFCDGLRNPQELVFDDLGNLFTLDNNSDGGDKARWTWLLEGSDTGWRQAYQWVNDPSRGPWNAEELWVPDAEGRPYYVLPPIANFTSGPSGLTIYPGTGWGADWDGTFFVCDFRGSPGYSGVYSFRNARDRSGFRLDGDPQEFLWDALPTDVDFGPDGDMYVSDWVDGWNQTGKGRVWRLEPTERPAGEAEAIAEVQHLLRGGIDELSDQDATALFEHRDRRVRQEAQLAIARRVLAEEDPRAGYEHLVPALKLLREPSDRRRGRVHALWCAWHVVRNHPVLGEEIPRFFIGLLFDPDREMAAQAARVLGDIEWTPAGRRLGSLLIDEEPRVRLYAAQALGRVGDPATAAGPLLELLETDGATDPWIRTVVIRALERLGDPGAVHEALTHEAPHVRQALTVVLRRWNDGVVAAMLEDESAAVRAEAARAIYDARIEEAMGALAAWLERAPEGTDAFALRRALFANREVGSVEAAVRLADFAASGRATPALRARAIDVLARWTDPMTRDGVVQDHRPIPGGDAAALSALAEHPVAGPRVVAAAATSSSGGDAGRGARRLRAALGRLHVALLGRGLVTAERFADTFGPVAGDGDVRAYQLLVQHVPEQPVVDALTSAAVDDASSPLRTAAFGRLDDAEAAERLLTATEDDDPARCAEAIEILGGLRGPVATATFGELGAELAMEGSGLLVDWLRVAEKHPDEAVKAAVGGIEGALADADDALARWRMCIAEDGAALGDAERGRRIFTTKSETSCLKCHVVGGEGGSEAGPALDGVGARLAAEGLLRSIVEPNAEIAEGYETWILLLDDGETWAGRIVEETDALVVLETNEKEQYEFEPAEIQARRRDVSAMPADVSTHLSRTEMRDLIAFLRSLDSSR